MDLFCWFGALAWGHLFLLSGVLFGTHFCYLGVFRGLFFSSGAHFLGLGGALGPLGVQGVVLGPFPGEKVIHFGNTFDQHLHIFQLFMVPVFSAFSDIIPGGVLRDFGVIWGTILR
jgi:hypothetical protein